jgi:nitrogen fixation/metabolism regulation signal transduction histidine kinase
MLSNPIVLRMALVLFACAFSFVMAVLIIRRMRRSLGEEAEMRSPASVEQLPMQMYHAVIQQLKQQKHELQTQQQAEHRRARTSEILSATIFSHMSSGVLFFGANGLARQANPAAKSILGIESLVGMNAEAIFRTSTQVDASQGEAEPMPALVRQTLADGRPSQSSSARYVTPSGSRRNIEVKICGVKAADGGLLGAACLVDDRSDAARLREEAELRGEVSAEMALALRNSLATISGYAQRLACNRDPELATQLANDITDEANRLEQTVGSFLAGKQVAKAAGPVL